MRIECVADYACDCGEGPLWHPDEGAIYWTDIPAGRLFRLHAEDGAHTPVYTDRPVGGLTLQEDGALALFRDRGNVVIWRNGVVERTVLAEIGELARTRFNDVCADPEGRVFCGTMTGPDIKGRLYRLDPDGRRHLLLENQGTPNGMGFSPDLRHFYYNDSRAARTWVFDYDRATGAIGNQRLCRDAAAAGDPGRPDGLAVDAEGFIWTGRWDGGALLRFDPEGRLALRIDLPARKITSLCFAGEDLSVIYATSAGGGNRPADGALAGALFRITGLNIRGMPRFRSRL